MSRYSVPVWQMDLEAMKELGGNKRWVTIIPWGNNLYYLLLVKAFGEEE